MYDAYKGQVSDPEMEWFLIQEKLARRYGWSFEYIDNLEWGIIEQILYLIAFESEQERVQRTS